MTNTVLIKASKRQKFNDAEKQDLLWQYEQSGMTRNQFAKKHGLNPASLSQWKQKFGSKSVVPFKRTESVLESHCATTTIDEHTKAERAALEAEIMLENISLKQKLGEKEHIIESQSFRIASMEAWIGRKLFELEMSKKAA